MSPYKKQQLLFSHTDSDLSGHHVQYAASLYMND